MNFEDTEDRDGVRVTWNNVPKSKLQHQRNVAPLAVLYTPFNKKAEVPLLEVLDMHRCRQCKAFLNPFATVNPQAPDVWYCQFCQFGNRIGGAMPPAALLPENTTVEFVTGREAQRPPIFMYVVDTCFEGDDVGDAFASLRDLLILSLLLLPADALVGLVSFGRHVSLHNLAGSGSSFVFNGSKEYTREKVEQMLGLTAGMGATGQLSAAALRFLQPVHLVEYQLATILERLANNTFPHSDAHERPDRATGSAVQVATLALQGILGAGNTSGGHIMCFIGGAATYGPGKIVGKALKEPMRSHSDIDKSGAVGAALRAGSVDTLLYKQARNFYGNVARTLISMGISCDFFIGSYDQVGLAEMDEVCSRTGGVVVMCDSFSTAMFRQSFVRFLHRDEDDALDVALNATLECRTTLDLQIQGLVGHASGLPLRKDRFAEASVAPQAIGEGGTNAWKLCSASPQSTYAVFFDKLDSSATHAFIQFSFHYQHAGGDMRLRITTIPLGVVADSDGMALEAGFDQEAAVVAIARNAVDKLRANFYAVTRTSYDHSDVVKHMDKLLVDFCTRFAVYQKNVVDLFRLTSAYAMLPQFIYHLRRSPFIRVFNNSPDETSFVRHVLMQEDLSNLLIMVQPTLVSYNIDTYEEGSEPEPVLLDSMSLAANTILLLDTFFHILIYHGSTVAQWRKADYHNTEGYEHFKAFLEAPKKEAMSILMDRFPLPRFIDCDEGGSQARFLMAKLNPSTSYSTNPNHMYGGQLDVMTDDTNLQLFMMHIQRTTVMRK